MKYAPNTAAEFVFLSIQDSCQKMAQHRDHHQWKEYSLEGTLELLSNRFPRSCVWIVKASRLHLNTFACYKNFFNCNQFGVPEYSYDGTGACSQVLCLMESVFEEGNTEFEVQILNAPSAVFLN